LSYLCAEVKQLQSRNRALAASDSIELAALKQIAAVAIPQSGFGRF